MKSIKCNIIKAGRGDVYGRPFAIGQIYAGPFDYVRQLVSCGYATVDDAAVFDDDSTPQNSEIAIVGKGRMAVEAELNEVTGGLGISLNGKKVSAIGGDAALASDRVLTANGSTLECGGIAVREMGVCAYQLLTDYLAGTNQNVLTELPLIAQNGFRFVRVAGAPLWSNGWAATYGTDKAAYFAKIKKFLDVAAEYKLGIIMSVFWRHATQPDRFGERVKTALAGASATRTAVATIIQEYAERFATHPAFAAWEIGNEYSLFAANGSLPAVNNGNGTPASYSGPDDVLTLDTMRSFFTFVGQTIKQYDTTGRIVMTGNGGPGGVIEKGIETYKRLVPADNPSPIDTLLIHKYSRNEFGNRAYADLYDTIVELINVGKSVGKPFILGEFGMERNETYGGYGGDTVFQTACEAIYRSGVQLSLAWNWARNSSTVQASNFDFHPYNTTNGTNTKLEILRRWNERMRHEGGVVSALINPTQPIRPTGKFIDVPAAGAPVLLTVADAAIQRPTGQFAVAFRARLNRGDLTNRRVARKYGTNSGWLINFDDSAPNRTFYMQICKSDGSTQNLKAQTQQKAVGEWSHFIFQLNSTSGQATSGLSSFENGRWTKTLAFVGTWNPATDPLLFFADVGNATAGYVGLKDFILLNRALTDVEARNLYLYDEAPAGTVVAEYKFNGDLTDSSGNGNNATLTSGAPVYLDF